MSAALIARLEALLLWAEAGVDDGRFSHSYGICTNVDAPHDIAAAALSWPEFSGNPEYPVPAPVNYAAAWAKTEGAHYAAYWDRTLPQWSGEYGEARIRLLKHCIEYFKEKTA